MSNTRVLYNYGEWTIHQHERDRFVLRFVSWQGRELDTTGRWPAEAVYNMLMKLRGMLWQELHPRPLSVWHG